MKKLLPVPIIALCLSITSASAQVEIFNWQGHAIGADASGPANCAMGAMPDVILINSTYYMYYIARYNNANAIYYATSPDLVTWDVQDTIMVGSSDTLNRLYDLGGPGVMKLNNGSYRLFYRTAQKASPPNEPLFHVRSMISSDGINFTHESGVRIENVTYQPGAYFKSASHPSVYKDAFGVTRVVMTGRDTTMNINSPARLYTAVSSDEGLTWSGFQPLYNGCHDPVVIKDSTGIYHMYVSYMATGHREATSADGVSWPVTPDSMAVRKNNVVLNEMTTSEIIADLGAAVDANGAVYMYSNFKPQGPGPWVDIAYYIHDPSSGITESQSFNSIGMYPNPAGDVITLQSQNASIDHYEIKNVLGQIVQEGAVGSDGVVSLNALAAGTYVISVYSKSRYCGAGKLVRE